MKLTFDDLENIISLFFTIISLLLGLFMYIRKTGRRYLFIIAFCILKFLSDYFWTVYQLIMHDTPSSYRFLSNSGWDIGYLVLLLIVIHYQSPERRRFFHPLILWPVITGIPQWFLYYPYETVIANTWEVGVTTLTLVFCMKDIVFYAKNKTRGAAFPYLSTLIFGYTVTEYCMWSFSCFEWPGELLSPYFYFNIINSLITVFFAWGAGKDQEAEEGVSVKPYDIETRTQASVQSVLAFVIFGGCIAGFFFIKKFADLSPEIKDLGRLSIMIYVISLGLISLIMALLHVFSEHYKKIRNSINNADTENRSKNSFIITLSVTFLLMVVSVIYNARTLHSSSVAGVYEDGKDKAAMTATDLENYLTKAETTLRVAADTVELMEKNGNSSDDIFRYLTDETGKQMEQFDENFTGIYAYINGEYMDGSGWIPPDDYDPESRDWYKTASENPGEVLIVPPYLDAQTGYVVVTVAKCISEADIKGINNVVCLDVIVNYVKNVIIHTDIAGKGFGMVINEDGFIIAHRKTEMDGRYIQEVYDSELLDQIKENGEGSFSAVLDDEVCTVFVHPVLEQWYAAVIVSETELLEEVNSQLAVNILVSLVIFFFITYFYYLGYRNEKNDARKIEDMNIRIVTALASTIDAKDHYTSGHSQRVADYALMIAKRMGKSKEDLRAIYAAGLLHDVGKIRVPEGIINKPGRLEENEMDSIRIHPVSGYDILIGLHEDERIGYGAKYHHERYDGSGYPNCLEGDNIPEVARIIAVADAYDAMASDRSYRKALPQAVIREEIQRGRGKQFDPDIADVMLAIIDEDKNYELKQKEKDSGNILVIDDEKIIIKHVKHILEDMEGTTVISATGEEEAFAVLGKTEISLIILDLMMPGTDGFELFNRIRKNYSMPVILMTGDKSKETIEKIHRLGIDDYVTKPLNPAILKEAVFGLLHRTELGSERI